MKMKKITVIASLIGGAVAGLATVITNGQTIVATISSVFEEKQPAELRLMSAAYNGGLVGPFGAQAFEPQVASGPGGGILDFTVSYNGPGHVIIDEIESRSWVAQAYDGGSSGNMPVTAKFDVVYLSRMPVLMSLGCPVRVASGDSVRMEVQLHRQDSPMFGYTVAVSLNYANSNGGRSSLPLALPLKTAGSDVILPTEEFLVEGEKVQKSKWFRNEGRFEKGMTWGLPIESRSMVEDTATIDGTASALKEMNRTAYSYPFTGGIPFPPSLFENIAPAESLKEAVMSKSSFKPPAEDVAGKFLQFDFTKDKSEHVLNDYRQFILDQARLAYVTQNPVKNYSIRLRSPECVTPTAHTHQD
jgi:hypothetical protein